MKDKIYLGDGVYAAQDGYYIWLWTEDGISESPKIALELPVLNALFKYRDMLLERVRVASSISREDAGDANDHLAIE